MDNSPLIDPWEFQKQQQEEEARIQAEIQAERDFEFRAAFGDGYEVVNVLTGETYKDQRG